MNIENHMYNAKIHLETCQAKIEAKDYNSALALLAQVYSNVRNLIDLVYELKRTSSAAARSAGEDTG